MIMHNETGFLRCADHQGETEDSLVFAKMLHISLLLSKTCDVLKTFLESLWNGLYLKNSNHFLYSENVKYL